MWLLGTKGVWNSTLSKSLAAEVKTKFQIVNGKPDLLRLPEINYIRPWTGQTRRHQPVHRSSPDRRVWQLRRRPADAGVDGNRKWTAFYAPVHHTDAVREYAYDRKSSFGKLDKALDEANEKGWTVVSMKDDWKTDIRIPAMKRRGIAIKLLVS